MVMGCICHCKPKKRSRKIKKKIKVIDLRWLSSVNIKGLLDSIRNCKNVLIVDECRKTGCHGENIFYQLKTLSDKEIKIKLHAAEDTLFH